MKSISPTYIIFRHYCKFVLNLTLSYIKLCVYLKALLILNSFERSFLTYKDQHLFFFFFSKAIPEWELTPHLLPNL